MTEQTTPHLPDAQRPAVLEGLSLLNRVFRGPDAQFCIDFIRDDPLRPFKILSPLLTCDPSAAIEEIEAFISGHADSNSLFETLEESYVRLFISNRGGIPAPLYQSCYEDTGAPGKSGFLMGKAAIDMQQRLESAGLSLDDSLGQMPDHLSLEIEYLYFLMQEESPAKGSGGMEQSTAFSLDTLLPWVRGFRQRLDDAEEEIPFYPLMASLLISLLKFIAGSPGNASFGKKNKKSRR